MKKTYFFLIIIYFLSTFGCNKDSNPVSNPLDTEKPTVAVLYPINGSTLNNDTTYTVISDANDNKGVSTVDFYIDGYKVGTDDSVSYEYSWITTKAGDHSIMAKASDAAGNVGISSVITVKVIITNFPPAVPSNPLPTNNAVGVSISPTLSWSCSDPDGDSLSYDVYFDTNTNPITQVAIGQSVKTLPRSGLADSTTYYWKVVASDNSKGTTTSGPVWSFTTNKSPNTPSNPNPANATTGISLTPTLSWSCSDPDGDALTYDVYFDTNTNPITLVATGQSVKTLPRSGLTHSSTYYWKVVAKDAKGATTTGSVWSFTTGANNPPSEPSNPNPANATTGISLTPTLSWSCSDPDGDALTYDVYFDTSTNPITLVATGQSVKTLPCSGLSISSTYYWKVVAKDAKGATTTGSVWSFTTNKPPNEPSNPNPANTETGVLISPILLSWSCSDPDGDALTYDVYFDTSTNPITLVATSQSVKTLPCSGLSISSTYYWKVVAKDAKGATTTGSVWSFTTLPSTPTNIEMVFVQNGTYQMGSTTGNTDEQPVHSVTLSNFSIGKYEITQKQWREVVQWKQGNATTPLNPVPSLFNGDNLPVEQVSWDDIQAWIAYLNEKEGSTIYRLPTEAEWEYAAFGGNNSQGYTYSGSNNSDLVAWYSTNSDNTTHTVGIKVANELGIYDMSGNVFEWCSDWYGAYSSIAQTNPSGPTSGTSRVAKGGSWGVANYNGNVNACRITNRGCGTPRPNSSSRSSDFGFRLAKDMN